MEFFYAIYIISFLVIFMVLLLWGVGFLINVIQSCAKELARRRRKRWEPWGKEYRRKLGYDDDK